MALVEVECLKCATLAWLYLSYVYVFSSMFVADSNLMVAGGPKALHSASLSENTNTDQLFEVIVTKDKNHLLACAPPSQACQTSKIIHSYIS